MKRLIWLILAVFLSYGASEAHQPQRGRNFGLFYNSLGSQGEWINLRIGTVWRPYHVGHDWRPYLNGRWIWTDYGWYWSSYEPFGWATYHYGRWTYDDYYGWIWIPGDEWGPAWVEWRYNDDYIGWAPLPPLAGWSLSVGVTFGRPWNAPVHYWNFVPCGNFSSVSVVNYVQAPDVTRRIFGKTRLAGSVRVENNRIVNDAVKLDRVQRRSAEQIRKVGLIDGAAPGEDRVVRKNGGESLEIYRPGSKDARRTGVGRDAVIDNGARGNDRNVAPKREAQRSPESTRRNRVYQNDAAQSRSGNQEMKKDRPSPMKERNSVSGQRPPARRETPAPRHPSSSKKRKPDG